MINPSALKRGLYDLFLLSISRWILDFKVSKEDFLTEILIKNLEIFEKKIYVTIFIHYDLATVYTWVKRWKCPGL